MCLTPSKPSKFLGPLYGLVFAGVFLLLGSASAQTAISSWTLNTVIDSPDATQGGITFQNKVVTLNSFTAGGDVYLTSTGRAADNVYVRRNTAVANSPSAGDNTNGSSITVMRSSSNTTVHGKYYSTLEAMLLEGNLLNATADTFQQRGSAETNNIERIDYTFTGGYTVAGDEQLTFFNLDPAGAQDNFRVSVITGFGTTTIGGVSTTNVPTSYANDGVSIVDGLYGPLLTLPVVGGTTTSWRLLSYTNGSNLSGTLATNNALNTNGVGGVALSFADLGVSVGTTIYGYSIMGLDVKKTAVDRAGTGVDLVDWTNATVYSTTTNSTDGTADFSTAGGRLAKRVPEPSTYGLIIIASMTALMLGRRHLVGRLTKASS
jgi:hypothetical protein